MTFKLNIKTAKDLAAERAAAEAADAAAQAEQFLRETDWMVIRELEGAKAMPASVKAERLAARARASKR